MPSTSSLSPPEWRLRKFDPDQLQSLGRAGIPEVIQKILAAIGLKKPSEVTEFMESPLDGWLKMRSFPSLSEGVRRLKEDLEDHQPVCIHGDFDTDGLCATRILTAGLEALGVEAFGHLPSRSDGHGISPESLKEVIQRGARSIITVDCGIGAMEVGRQCRELGIPLYITDHHLAEGELPQAAAIINPQVDEEATDFRTLSGSGVALKVILELSRYFPEHITSRPAFQSFFRLGFVLAAIATVADVMPLLGDNRSLVKRGLALMPEVEDVGLKALIDHVAGGRSLRAEDLAFQLIPRLNAPQRLGRGDLLWELFSTTCPDRAKEVCRELDGINVRRRELQARYLTLVQERAKASLDQNHPVIAVVGDEWPESFSGLMAGRLSPTYGKAAVVARRTEDFLLASCRCPPHLHLKGALDECSHHLIQYGGHAQAAGFKLKAEKWKDFMEDFKTTINNQCNGAGGAPKLTILAEVPWHDLNIGLHKSLEQLEPYGQGNPRPVFATRGLILDGPLKFIGADRSHVGFKVFAEGHPSLDAVAFGQAEDFKQLDQNGKIDLAYELGVSPYHGRLQLNVKSVRQHRTRKFHA